MYICIYIYSVKTYHFAHEDGVGHSREWLGHG